MADELSRVPDPLRRGPVLIGVFAVLAVLAAVGAVLALGGGVNHLQWALANGLLVTGGMLGIYLFGRRYGQPHSHAFAGAAIVFGVYVLAAAIAELLQSSGQLSDGTIGLGLGGAVLATVVIIALVAALDRATAA
jgi:peptidoglycan/LPS O-acetylase OafA/YrhL